MFRYRVQVPRSEPAPRDRAQRDCARALSLQARARAWTRARPAGRPRRAARRRPPAAARGRRPAPRPRSPATAAPCRGSAPLPRRAAGRQPPPGHQVVGDLRHDAAVVAVQGHDGPLRVEGGDGPERLAAGDLGHPGGEDLGHLPLGGAERRVHLPARARAFRQLEVPPLVRAAGAPPQRDLAGGQPPVGGVEVGGGQVVQDRRRRADARAARRRKAARTPARRRTSARSPGTLTCPSCSASPRVTGSLMIKERVVASPARPAVLVMRPTLSSR